MKRIIYLSLLSLVIILSSCGKENPDFTLLNTPETINSDLETAALLVAEAISDHDLATTLNQLLEAGFEGDTELLWSTMLNEKLPSGKSVESQLAQVYAKQTGLSLDKASIKVRGLSQSLPRLQIALRAAPEGWNPKNPTLVAFSPEGIEETEIKQIKAFDIKGKSTLLDAQSAPTEPVLVIGLNERSDDKGKPLKEQTQTTFQTQVFLPDHLVDKCRVVSVEDILLHDDHEPWHKGKPELWLQVNGGNTPAIDLFKGRFRDIEEGKRKTYNRHIVDWCPAIEGDLLGFLWFEQDSGVEITISPFLKGKVEFDELGVAVEAGVTFSFKIKDGDDEVGKQAIGKASGRLAGTKALVTRAPGDIEWDTLLEFDAADVSPPPPPLDPDPDNDGIDTEQEERLKQENSSLYGCLNPNDEDSDNDGLHDGNEHFIWHTSPCSPDTDLDGLRDGLETRYSCLDPNVPDANRDADNDGLSNRDEVMQGLDPCHEDSDGDGFSDDVDLCPLTPSQSNSDMDGDGIGDACDVDADGDGCNRFYDADDFDPSVFCTTISSAISEETLEIMFDERLQDPRLSFLLEGESWPDCELCSPSMTVFVDGEARYTLNAEQFNLSAEDGFASASAVMVDLDKDGIEDIAIGAALAQNSEGMDAAGQVLLLSGKDGFELARIEGAQEGLMLGKAFYQNISD